MSGGPRIVFIAPGSMVAPKGASAPAGAQGQAPAGNAAVDQGQAPAGDAAAVQGQAAPAPAGAATQTAQADSGTATAITQARTGTGLLQRALALLPLAAGITQVILGLMITRGTVSVATVPLLGSLPKFLVGSLTMATAMPSIMGGIAKLLGKG